MNEYFIYVFDVIFIFYFINFIFHGAQHNNSIHLILIYFSASFTCEQCIMHYNLIHQFKMHAKKVICM